MTESKKNVTIRTGKKNTKKAVEQEPTQKVVKDTFTRVKEWNTKAGNYQQPAGTAAYWNAVVNQAKRIEEELTELYEAINNKDIAAVIDAGADLDVVVSGLNYLSGSNYPSVIDTVLSNNDLKISTKREIVEQWKFYWEANGVDVYIAESNIDGATYYSLRREEDNKILKYANFPKVDLTPYMPQLVAEGYTLYKDKDTKTSEESLKFPSLYLDEMDDSEGVLAKVLEENETDKVLLVIVNGQLTEIKLFPEEQE